MIETPRTFTIRSREADDWEALLAISLALPASENPLGVPYPGRALAQHTFCAPDYHTNFGLVAVHGSADQSVVGEIALERGAGRTAHIGEITRLIVDPQLQQQGIGSALLAAAIDLAENGLNLARLHHMVPVDNAAALTLHQNHGFTIEGKLRDALFRVGRYMDAFILARVRDAF